MTFTFSMLVVTLVIGGLTGVFAHASASKDKCGERIIWPITSKKGEFRPGFLYHSGVGALAAFTAVSVVIPQLSFLMSPDASLYVTAGYSVLASFTGEAFLKAYSLAKGRQLRKLNQQANDILMQEVQPPPSNQTNQGGQ